MELSEKEQFYKKASNEQLFDYFTKISKAIIKQKKIKDKSVSKLLSTNIANKKQHDSLYAKQYNDNRIYNSYLEDLKIIIKYL